MVQSGWKDQLKASCAVVLQALQVDYSFPKDDGWEHVEGAVDHICRTAGVRCRRVSLGDAWWKKDCGPLLGFTADGQPQALIPGGCGVYNVYDPVRDRSKRLQDTAAASMQPYGFMFYPLLPAHRLSVKSVKEFARRLGLLRGLAEYGIFLILSSSLGLVFILFLQRLLLGEEQVLRLGLAFVFIAAAALLFRVKGETARLWIEGRVAFFLQAAVWDRLLRLPPSFFGSKTPWSLTTQVLGVSRIRGLVATAVAPGFSAFNAIVLYVGWISLYDWRIALLSAAVIAVGSSLMFQLGCQQSRYTQQLEQHHEQLTAFAAQVPRAIAGIRNAGAEEAVVSRWMTLYDGQIPRKEKLGIVAAQIEAFHQMLSVAAFGIVLFTASRISHWIPLTAVLMAFFFALRPIKVWHQSVSALGRIRDVAQQMAPIGEAVAQSEHYPLTGRIELVDVTFGYPQRSVLFDQISLTIEPGEYVGIAGATGCGKSTLLKILLGLVQPSAGQVRYDGRELQHVGGETVRHQVGMVLQSSTLAYGSVLHNVTGGDSHCTLEDAWGALSSAALADEIRSMPMGMQTILGPGGTPLSGGQRQRLLIARALLYRPRILLLDEATSSIDPHTLDQIMENLRKLAITRIVASHRPDALRDCDRLLRLKAGRIVEESVGLKGRAL